MPMKRTRLISFLLLLAIAPSGFSAPSGDAGSAEQNLEEILVTARSTLVSLGDQPIVDIPFTVLEVDQEQMQNLQAHTVLDVVKYQGSVTPVSSELVGNSQFQVRGFQSGFAPFIDGCRRNPAIRSLPSSSMKMHRLWLVRRGFSSVSAHLAAC
jgi:hypothetical protein